MTLTELKQAVLAELGVLATGEAPTIADATVVGDKYTVLHKMLAAENLVDWAEEEDIPNTHSEPIRMMVAAMCVRPFGLPLPRVVEFEQNGAFNLSPAKGGPSLAERQLRKLMSRRYVPHPAASDYF